MHSSSTHAANPFEMLIDPQAILRAVEGSSRLRSLQSKVWRPLDRPAKPNAAGPADQAAFDARVDGAEAPSDPA